MNQFVKLFTGKCVIDNSMSRNTPRFCEDEFPLVVRPRLIESIRHIRHGARLYSEVTLTGYDCPVHCMNKADDILNQIREIELGQHQN